MHVEHTISATRARIASLRTTAGRVALVPTMGALHDGHLALVDSAREAADVVVVSIFVNPLQFGPGEDLARYPRTLDADTAALRTRGVDIVFAPSAGVMYGTATNRTTVVPPPYADLFEGAIRPGHFTGMLTVVAKLFNIVQPDVAIFGRKDLQQLSLVRRMVADLNLPIEILAHDTVREADGLALSSRNRYLDAEGRALATRLREALATAKLAFARGVCEPDLIAASGRDVLERSPALSVDYLAVVRETDFSTPERAAPGDAIVGAVRVGTTRLLDNIQL